jgi:hypothetical protein
VPKSISVAERLREAAWV